MNPILNCCCWYCSSLMVLGLFFFGLLIWLIKTDNEFLHHGLKPGQADKQVTALGIAMGINAGLAIVCCTIINCCGKKRENLEEKDSAIFGPSDD